MSKPINICEWEDEFQFLITPFSERYESLVELEKKLGEVICYLDGLNKDYPNENLLGIEISKLAVNYTDKLVEFFGFADGNTKKPENFDQAYKTVTNMFLNVHQMNVDFSYFISQESVELQPDQALDNSKPLIKIIDISDSSKIELDESRLVITYKNTEVFLKHKINFKIFEKLCINHGYPIPYKDIFITAWEKQDSNFIFEDTDRHNLAKTKLELVGLLPKELVINIASTIVGTYVMTF